MAITVVSSVAAEDTDASDGLSITQPATAIAADDFMFFLGTLNNNRGGTAVPDAGPVTQICAELVTATGRDLQTDLRYAQASGGEESDVLAVTFASASSGDNCLAGLVNFRGVDFATGPFDVTPTHGTYHVAADDGNTPACPAITTATDGALVIVGSVGNCQGGSLSDITSSITPDGSLKLIHADGDYGFLIEWFIQASAGAATVPTHTYVGIGSTNCYAHAFSYALKPAAAATPTAAPSNSPCMATP